MPPDHRAFLPWVLALLIPLVLYRRFRRNFGRQPLAPVRRRLVIFGVLAVLIAAPALTAHSAALASGDIAGALIGGALAAWGASRTRFVAQSGQLYYVPHTYTGIAVSALFIGRLIFRMVQLYGAQAMASRGLGEGMDDGLGSPAAMGKSPLTAGIVFILIGYYMCYYGLVLRKSKHLTPGDLESPATPSAT